MPLFFVAATASFGYEVGDGHALAHCAPASERSDFPAETWSLQLAATVVADSNLQQSVPFHLGMRNIRLYV